MELRRYLMVIRQRWKLVAFVMLLTTFAAGFLVWNEEPVYEASGTYVVRAQGETSDDAVRATDTLNRGVEINSTYARVARSDVVKQRAREVLASNGISTSGLGISSEVIPGTNIIRITVSGGDPEAVAAYASAVGEQTAAFLLESGELFNLQELDTPDVPNSPEPSTSSLTVALGLVFGAAGGAMLAFVAHYLSEEPDRASLNIRDSMTGAYSDDYFRLRLRQEMSRCDIPMDLDEIDKAARDAEPSKKAKSGNGKSGNGKQPRQRTGPGFTVAMIEIQPDDPNLNGSAPGPEPLELRDAAQALLARLRLQDVLAYVGDGTFAVICPDLPARGTRRILTDWNLYLGSRFDEETTLRSLRASISTCQCDAMGVVGDRDALKAACDI
ncbi:MAG: Wzz/FepE/Etk N-terminal domain-containing protein [Actinomycetota bacterium]